MPDARTNWNKANLPISDVSRDTVAEETSRSQGVQSEKPIRLSLDQRAKHLSVRFCLPFDSELDCPEQLREYLEDDHVLQFFGRAEISIEKDLQNLKLRFESLSERYPKLYSANSRHLPGDELTDLVNEIREQGEPLFEKLVGGLLGMPEKPLRVDEQVWELMLLELRSALRKEGRVVLFRWALPERKPDFCFPWGVIFDPLAGSLLTGELQPIAGFWGLRLVLAEEWYPPQSRCLATNPQILASIDEYRDDRSVHMENDHPFHKDNKCCVKNPCHSPDELLKKLPSSDLYYYYGKSYSEHGNYYLHWHEKGKEEQIFKMLKLRTVKSSTKYSRPAVLVFLNGCDTSGTAFIHEDSFIGAFEGEIPSKVHFIATAAEVPATYAAHFAKSFFSKFLQNCDRYSVAEAVREARLDLARQRSDENPLGLESPIGLFYVMTGQHALRVSKE